jgi:oxygen-independent coproporphyrinogen-3 oxidase
MLQFTGGAMTTEIETGLAGPPAAGNYFVATYPPFSAWTPDQVGAVHRVLEEGAGEDADLGLYLHIPFCRKRCHFCYFKVYTDRTKEEISAYVEALASEIASYAEKPAVGGRPPTFLYFGGGTPSYLSVRCLHRLHDELSARFDLTGLREITFEGEPGTLSPAKIDALMEIGVTRLSIGVGSFSDEVLELNGRAHDSQQLSSACAAASAAGFPQVNIDLIVGMAGETEENWLASVARAIELGPTSVTIYQMEVPYNTGLSAQMRDQGAGLIADWPAKRRWAEYAFGELERVGYRVSSGYTMSRDASGSDFVYRDSLWHGADLVGLGVSSFSHVSGVHFQNEPDFATYIARVAAGELPVRRALAASPGELLIREFILQLKLGRVSPGYFQDKFSVDVLEEFRAPLEDLADRDLATVTGSEIVLSRKALLRVDSLLPAFFLPQHRGARYA